MWDQIEAFTYSASEKSPPKQVTACLYFNDAWLSQLPIFAQRWNGPMSVVIETLGSKTGQNKARIVSRLTLLRKKHPQIQKYADLHIVYTPYVSSQARDRIHQRFMTHPAGSNWHVNLARLFARTDLVWLVCDPRILPSAGLRRFLEDSNVMSALLLDNADAVVVPTFGFLRNNSTEGYLPTLSQIDARIQASASPDAIEDSAISEARAEAYLASHYATLPLPIKRWPRRKPDLLSLSSQDKTTTGDADPTKVLALYDRGWAKNAGPTNMLLWSMASSPTNLSYYHITEYDLRYAPSVIIGKDRQPWCMERFSDERAVCTYQMYLAGAKIWVLPDEWAFTLESIDSDAPTNQMTKVERLEVHGTIEIAVTQY